MAGDDLLRAESDLRFYQRRAAQERQMAARSVTEAARARHENLAQQFAMRIQEVQMQFA